MVHGSIGSLRMVPNFSNMVEAGNMENVDIITAPQSSEKVPYDPFKPMTQEMRAQLKEDQRPIAQMIIDAVKAEMRGADA